MTRWPPLDIIYHNAGNVDNVMLHALHVTVLVYSTLFEFLNCAVFKYVKERALAIGRFSGGDRLVEMRIKICVNCCRQGLLLTALLILLTFCNGKWSSRPKCDCKR